MHCNIPIFIPHLGCPFNCIFCDQKKISSQHQVPEINETLHIVERYLATMPPDADIEIAFFGGNFTSLPVELQESYLSTVQPFLESGRIGAIRLSTRPDCIDPDILARLGRYGVKTIELGVQSLNEDVLQASGRGYQVKQVVSACRLIKQFGFKLGIQLMIGLPGDTWEADFETVNMVIRLNPDMVRIYPTLVISGTALEKMYREDKYQPLELEEAVNIVALMYMKLQSHGIAVIRMGLQPSEDLLTPGTVAAGPFHPAFGELVEQKVYLQQAREVIEIYRRQNPGKAQLALFINSRETSKLVGYRKSNLAYLKNYFKLDQLAVKQVTGNKERTIGAAAITMEQPEVVLTQADFLSPYYSNENLSNCYFM
jgi:histone acetyltransferase (RNA polymerase elongator complex component)